MADKKTETRYLETDVNKTILFSGDAETLTHELFKNLEKKEKKQSEADSSLQHSMIDLSGIIQPEINKGEQGEGNNNKAVWSSTQIAKRGREILNSYKGEDASEEEKELVKKMQNNLNLVAQGSALLLSGKCVVGWYAKGDKQKNLISPDYRKDEKGKLLDATLGFDTSKHIKAIFGAENYPFQCHYVAGRWSKKADTLIAYTLTQIKNSYDAYFGGKAMELQKIGEEQLTSKWKVTKKGGNVGTSKTMTTDNVHATIKTLEGWFDEHVLDTTAFVGEGASAVLKTSHNGSTPTLETVLGAKGFKLDENPNGKAIPKPIKSDVAIALEAFANRMLKKCQMLEAQLELQRINLEEKLDNSLKPKDKKTA